LDNRNWFQRFGDQVNKRVGESVQSFQNGWNIVTDPPKLAEKMGSGFEEFGRRSENFKNNFFKGTEALSTDAGRAEAADLFGRGSKGLYDYATNNSAETSADAILTYLLLRSPSALNDIAAKSAAAARLEQRIANLNKQLEPLKNPKPKCTTPKPKELNPTKKPLLAAKTAKDAVDEATNAAKGLDGTPKQKADLLDDLLTQAEKTIDGFKVSIREIGTDGSHIFAGQQGEARVVHPTTGDIYGGKYGTGTGFDFKAGSDGNIQTTPNYNNLNKK
jgi:hypothetical protein